jgi:hypothetical protein
MLILIKSPEYAKKFSSLFEQFRLAGINIDVKYSFKHSRKNIIEDFFSQVRNMLTYYCLDDDFSRWRWSRFVKFKFLLKFNLKRPLAFLERFAPVPQFAREVSRYNAIFVIYRNAPCSCLETDYIKAAKRYRVPIFVMNSSWDSFETKGVMTVEPDATFVFNAWQKSWIERVYQFRNVVVVGCPLLALGKASRPFYVTYLGSSKITGDGQALFERICQSLGDHPAIKFHPKNIFNISNIHQFDSLSEALNQSSCVISLNSSTIIDAIAKGIPAIAIVEAGPISGIGHWKNICASGLVKTSTISDLSRNIREWRGPLESLRDALLFPRKDSPKFITDYILTHVKRTMT